jgi:putative heme-binding domain-containing protein
VPENSQRTAAPKLGSADGELLVKALEHPNGWHRDTASRLLVERNDSSVTPLLKKTVTSSPAPFARLHALYVLSSLKALDRQTLLGALRDSAPEVRENALRLAEIFGERKNGDSTELWNQMVQLAADPDIRVRYQLALTVGEFERPGMVAPLAQVAQHDTNDLWITTAVLSSAKTCAPELLATLGPRHLKAGSPTWNDFLRALVTTAIAFASPGEPQNIVGAVANLDDTELRFDLLGAVEDAAAKEKVRWPADQAARLRQVHADALNMATNRAEATSLRVAAIQLAARNPQQFQTRGLITPLLDIAEPEPIRMATVKSLARFGSASMAPVLLSYWNGLTASLRSEMLALLLPRSQGATAVLEALSVGTIGRGELLRSQVDFLRNHPTPAVREKASEIFRSGAPGNRDRAIEKYKPSLSAKGNAENGKEIFKQRCSSCHHLEDLGTPVGPDLTSVKSAGRESLLTNIIDPNREVASRYISYLLQTRSGDSYSGILVREGDASITLKEALGYEHVVPRDQIASLNSAGKSIMPEGLEEGLTTQEMADLLEFVLSANPPKNGTAAPTK